MQEALRNKSGKPVSVENLDKRDEARNKRSSNPIAKEEAIDRDAERNRLAQARAEQGRVSENPQDSTEFNVRKDG
jgi:hypothetical protein